MITTVIFDLHGVLINPTEIRKHYAGVHAAILARRYGGPESAWLDAYQQVYEDWDSYWADLDLDGDNGMDDFWEGELRVLRALFRLSGRPYPPGPELEAFNRTRRYLALREFNAAYPDVPAVLDTLKTDGYKLGIVSNAVLHHCRGALAGAGILGYFDRRITGSDMVGTFSKGADTYRYAFKLLGAEPETCLVVDDNADGVIGARSAGARVMLLERPDRDDKRPLSLARSAAHDVLTGLDKVPGYIRRLKAVHPTS